MGEAGTCRTRPASIQLQAKELFRYTPQLTGSGKPRIFKPTRLTSRFESGRDLGGANVLNKAVKTLMGVILIAAVGYAQDQPKVKDQGEYDLFNAITKEQDPVKKLALLDQWSEKYADTEFKQQRNYFYIDTYSKIAPLAVQPSATPDQVAAGKKAANTLIEKADTLFAPANKLPNVTDDQWAAAKKAVLTQAHTILGQLASNSKDFATAEAEFKKVVEVNPNDANMAYALGTAILSQKKIDRYPEVIWQYARAVGLTGPGAMKDEALKKSTDDYLKRLYNNYHGDPSGLDDVRAKAITESFPPSGFHIESVTEISQRANANAEEFAKSFPAIMVWRGLKDKLVAEGDAYFDQMKGSEIPDLKGKVVAQPSPSELTISMDYADPKLAETPEVTLKLDSPLAGTVEKGTLLTFAAVPVSYTKSPFMLMMTAEKEKVQGLGDAAGPATPVKKPAATKKKAVTTTKKKTP
jgi:tetratricopeptide (TPR) repeat protein